MLICHPDWNLHNYATCLTKIDTISSAMWASSRSACCDVALKILIMRGGFLALTCICNFQLCGITVPDTSKKWWMENQSIISTMSPQILNYCGCVYGAWPYDRNSCHVKKAFIYTMCVPCYEWSAEPGPIFTFSSARFDSLLNGLWIIYLCCYLNHFLNSVLEIG